MERLICEGCGQGFDRPKRIREPHGEVRRVSPCCGEGFALAALCAQCGQETPASQTEHGLCRKCRWMAVEEFQWVLDHGFTQRQRAVINGFYDGRPLV